MSEWKKVKIGEFLTESKVLAEESDAAHRITVRLNCKGVEKRGLKAEKEGATKYYTRYAGQFIYGKQNIHKGAFGVIPKELDGFTSSADLPAFDIDKSKCIPEWLCLCLKVDERYKTLQKDVKGVGSQRLAVNIFLNVEIPLPNLSEQKRIVSEISEKLENIQQMSDEVEKQKAYAKQLRQNILQEAIEGKLTADWRKQHPVQKGNPDYDAEALFDKIQAEMSEAKSTKKSLAPISKDEIPFEIPTGWKWVRLGEICSNVVDCPHTTPIKSEVKTNYPCIRTSEIKNGKIEWDSMQYLNYTEYKKRVSRLIPQENDIVYAREGAFGDAVLLPTGYEFALGQRTMLLRVDANHICPKYVLNSILSPFLYAQALSQNRGATVGHVNVADVKNFTLPLPPLAEQKEIVARVEQHLQTIAQLETQIATRETLTKQLMQGLLKDAFER